MESIAGVFMNKLNNLNGEGSYLRSSVTVCYAFDLDKDACKIVDTAEEEYVLKDVPYNTYMNEGLPPGPVLCPDERTLRAGQLLYRQERHHAFGRTGGHSQAQQRILSYLRGRV